ncbi:MAG TPA: flagellar hook protein FliD [Oxalobacteraceae bacterium]|nr:flagellar hook protein FliD [Oxalobacteraceae bacterium]
MDVNSIVSQLMAVEAQPLTRLTQKEASYQAKLSAFGTVSGALSSFQTAIAQLANPSKFQSMTASSGDTAILTGSATSKAATGAYNVNVTSLAQAQTLKSAGQGSTSAKIGTGTETTITFQFGTITGTAAGGVYPDGSTFTQDATRGTGTIKIDSTNNTLQGIRDAINKSDFGVTATIINDGSATPNRLVLTSNKTGQMSSMKISVSSDGDPALQALLGYDPAVAADQKMTEAAAAQNTVLTVNGIIINSQTKTISDAIQGVTLNANKIGSTTFSVSKDTNSVTTTVNDFVKSYNELNGTLKKLTSYDAATKQSGLLFGDATIRSLQVDLRQTLTAANANAGSLKNLAEVGVTFQKDGTLAVDSAKLQKAITNSAGDVAALFSTLGRSTDDLVSVAESKPGTKAGNYEVVISNTPKQGYLTGDRIVAGSNTTIDPGSRLNVTLDGVTAKVSLAEGSYTDQQLTALLQSAINGTSAFSTAGLSVTASVDADGHLKLTSSRYGTASKISITNDTGTSIATLFGAAMTSADGEDVAGTIGGIAATGAGQFLTGPTNTVIDGLKLQITGGSTGTRGTVSFSTGVAGQLSKLLDSYLGSEGIISGRTGGINDSIKSLEKSREAMSIRLFATEKRYRAQFTALDTMINSMTSTSNFLQQQLSNLPKIE